MNYLWAPPIVRCQPAPITEDPFEPREPGLPLRLMEVMTSRYNRLMVISCVCLLMGVVSLVQILCCPYMQRLKRLVPETVIEPYKVSRTHLIVTYYSNTSDLRLRSHQVRHCGKTQHFSFIFNEASRGTAVYGLRWVRSPQTCPAPEVEPSSALWLSQSASIWRQHIWQTRSLRNTACYW